MLTKAEMLKTLSGMGCEKIFKPFTEPENNVIMLKTKKPATVTDGIMRGCDIHVYDPQTFDVWTSQTKKAVRIAREHSLKIEALDGEVTVFVPANLADELLPKFGAKVKRKISEKQILNLRQARLLLKPPINARTEK